MRTSARLRTPRKARIDQVFVAPALQGRVAEAGIRKRLECKELRVSQPSHPGHSVRRGISGFVGYGGSLF